MFKYKTMKTSFILKTATALLLSVVASSATAATFFSDNFSAGSTLNNATPANPTTTSTAYQIIANKAWNPNPPTMVANDLKFGIAATTSGYYQAQTLFANNPVALVLPGDYIQLTVVFTNTSGLLTAAGQLGFGLFSSGQVKPVPGGINNSVPASFTGYAQNWVGYNANINFTGAASRISTRPAQTLTTIANQDLFTFGTSSSYAGGAIVGTATGNATLTAGSTYTEVLTITMVDANNLAITNLLYAGPDTSGTLVTNFGAVAAAPFTAAGFDALVIGYCGRANTGGAPLIDVSSIQVSGSVTPVTGPPTIDQQPVNVTVPSGGSCAFSVAATGFSVTYQWHRNGTNLVDGGNISGANSSQLVISPAGPGDNLSGANGYYVTVTGAGPFSTNSETHSLSFGTAKNLIWSGGGSVWDLNNSANWVGSLLFNYGDAVTFDDVGGGGLVTLNGSYLSASSVTVNHTSSFYTFQGTGSFAGPGSLIYKGSAQLTINNANTFTGGTIISNSTANLRLQNLGGLGTGPVTFAAAGSKLSVLTASSSSTSINSDLIVADDASIVLDPNDNSFAMVLNGNLSGTASKTLTINHGANGTGTNATRIRINGTSSVYDANLVLNDVDFVWSPSGSGSQTYNGVISGAGKILQKNGTTYLNGANTYSGGTMPAAGSIGLGRDSSGPAGSPIDGPLGTGPLLLINDSTTTLLGSGTVFASGGARVIGNPIQYANSTNNITLIIGGTNSLTFTGPFSLQGNDGLYVAGTNRIVQADNTAGSTLSGVIGDNGFGIGLVKTGTNSLFLNANNTYSGLTTVSAGVLAGSGTIAGSVLVQTNARIGGGSSVGIGTLTINGNLTITNGGGGYFRVNRSGSASDKASVTGTLASSGTGTITVTNLGTTLQVGDTFTLFNKPVTGGSTLVVTGGGVAWANMLAANGTIQVIPGVDTNPTNITTVVNNGNLELSWPANHTGWHLQVQTNTLAIGLGTNWVVIPNTDLSNSYTNPISPGNGSVFYRMIYP